MDLSDYEKWDENTSNSNEVCRLYDVVMDGNRLTISEIDRSPIDLDDPGKEIPNEKKHGGDSDQNDHSDGTNESDQQGSENEQTSEDDSDQNNNSDGTSESDEETDESNN